MGAMDLICDALAAVRESKAYGTHLPTCFDTKEIGLAAAALR